MKAEQFFVSVIIPVYNGERFLAEAVETVHAQEYDRLEIIVVDDGSTDRTSEIITSLKGDIQRIGQKNSGPAAARNRGLSAARGDVIAFLDADDLWPETKLKTQIPLLADHPEVDIITGLVQYVELPEAEPSGIRFQSQDNSAIHVHPGAGLFRRAVFEKVGLFDETLCYGEDHDWFLRARERGISIHIMNEITYHYRRHQHNMTGDKVLTGSHLFEVLKRSLDRRRTTHDGVVGNLRPFSSFQRTIDERGEGTKSE